MKFTGPRLLRNLLPGLLSGMVYICGLTSNADAKTDLHQVIPEVRLKDGTVLHAVTFVSVGSSSVTGKWEGGRGSIPLAQLSDELHAEIAALAPPKTVPAATTSNASRVASPAIATPSSPAPAVDPEHLPTDIKLTNGFVMHDAKAVSWQADAMMVAYPGGRVSVKFENIVPEQREAFVTHKNLVFARQARIDASQAAKNSTLLPGQHPPRAPTLGEMAALIKAGIAEHQLVVGMNREQIVQAVGMPDGTQSDPATPEHVFWLYRRRGKTPAGQACDRIVGLNNGYLIGGQDN
ncbi:MAG: hypothetical protein ABI222_17365 [Opitutaceae bacterium]